MSDGCSVEALLLGIAQDAGVPQAGCACPTCARARREPTRRQLPVCLALIDHASGASWMLDATPAFPEQLELLQGHTPGCPLAGVLLTHAHIGHYTGLMYLGREAMGSRRMPVYATPALCAFLRDNGPWSQLVDLEYIALQPIAPGQPLALTPELTVVPLPVPHRAEFSDTVAFLVRGPQRALFYCPDIDRWEQWGESLPHFLKEVDIALLDGTFFSADELPGRDMHEITHPLVTDTAARVAGTACAITFIHLNHSNALLREEAPQRWLAEQGMGVGIAGRCWGL
jgi:pyrroloquinoline quinone biosynthesis protein B